MTSSSGPTVESVSASAKTLRSYSERNLTSDDPMYSLTVTVLKRILGIELPQTISQNNVNPTLALPSKNATEKVRSSSRRTP